MTLFNEEYGSVELQAHWRGGVVTFTWPAGNFACCTVADLKCKIYKELLIPVQKQTLLYATNSQKKGLSNDDLLKDLSFTLQPTLSYKPANGMSPTGANRVGCMHKTCNIVQRHKGMLLVECDAGASRTLIVAFALMGTPEVEQLPECGTGRGPDSNHNEIVVNDLNDPTCWNYDPWEVTVADVNYQNEAAACAGASPSSRLRSKVNLKRLGQAIKATRIEIMHSPRPKSKLLVLDFDSTLCDCRASTSIYRIVRPHLYNLLKTAYRLGFDLVIWSQISRAWVEAKCQELGIMQTSEFSICFVLDRTSMFTLNSLEVEDRDRAHEVKALEIVWTLFGDSWGPHNTLHVDDNSQYFAMNPRNGIRVEAYRKSKYDTDRDLRLLASYLTMIAGAVDFTKMDHSKWIESASRLAVEEEKKDVEKLLTVARNCQLENRVSSPSLVLNFGALLGGGDSQKEVHDSPPEQSGDNGTLPDVNS